MFSTISSLLAYVMLVPVVAGLHYAIPKELMAEADCYFPQNYTIQHLTSWTPAAGNSNSSTLDFTFVDKGAPITTPCHFNASSKSLTEGKNLTDRYACDNSLVNFIWQRKNELSMFEALCSGSSSPKHFEASGLLRATLDCKPTDSGFVTGDGTLCSMDSEATANFTSVQPSPF